ncbi:carboxylesterase/lipase family protein [Streptomyces sp. ISL-11]|uniref:carboxylesterase/lipase family protein n=1 Tax=Streptomyces sp. ISL-11 TaxID=2819174 RepID=UPI001BE7B85D|nr:carboxylesterase family protein [Streptomyces sp. ISL-11]MBT2387329.1 carboxylesterase family protein [Streptomyces sp. ISL-11]
MPKVRPSSRPGEVLCALLLALLTLVAATGAAPANGADDSGRPVVDTDHGPVRGRAHGTYATFDGIPYAAPPTGPLRWRLPVPAAPWKGVRDAGAPSGSCAQVPVFGGDGKATGSEDCLYVNVTTPTGRAPHGGRPVMVWIHGGGFTVGSGSDYRPEPLAVRGDAMVVTVNYRLGIFGFFGHPELGAPDFGIADQQAALRWVRANAARFGGDPGRVTVFGESAGALSTCAHLTSPTAAGLFHRAALQSGACMTAFPRGSMTPTLPAYEPFVPRERVEAAGTAAARGLGCDRPGDALACLRGLDTGRLLTADLMQAFSGVAYGNALLPERPDRALEGGRFHRVPVLQGSNLDEMRLFLGFTLKDFPIRDEREYRARLALSYGEAAGAVEALYPAAKYPTPALAWAASLSDASFTCGALRADRALAGRVPTYGYRFDDRNAPHIMPGLPVVEGFPYGAAHGFELPYLFTMPTDPPLSAAQRELSATMLGYWTRFARTGDPNSAGAPAWPRYDASERALSLSPGAGGIKPVDAAAEHHCDFWAAHRV